MAKVVVLLVILSFVSALQAWPGNTILLSDEQEALSVTVRQDRLESLFEQALERITYLERQLVQQNGKMDSINKSSPMDRATGLPLPTSCADVYQNGHYLNNFFMVKGTSGMIETVFCDFRNSTGQVETRMGYVDVKTSPVYFYVQRDSSYYSSGGSAIPWTKSKLNVGNAMNLGTGVFTVPRDGIYHFAFSGMKYASTQELFVYLRVNGNNIGLAEAAQSSVVLYETFSIHSTLQLNKGDNVDLWFIGGHASLYDKSTSITHFTGWLVEENLHL